MTSNTALPEKISISVDELDLLGDFKYVDIRRDEEVAASPLSVPHIHIPMDDLLNNPTRLEKEATYVLVCAAGIRTDYTANAFRSVGYKKVYSLIGGAPVLREA